MASERAPSHVKIPIWQHSLLFKGAWRHRKNPLTSSPKFPQNGYTEKIKNLHSKAPKLEAHKPTQNPEIPKKHRVHTNFFERFARTFAFFSVTRVRNRTEIVQKNLFRWTFLILGGFFRVDFPPLANHNITSLRPLCSISWFLKRDVLYCHHLRCQTQRALRELMARLAVAYRLRGAAAILFVSRNTCSDSIAKIFGASFYGDSTTLLRDR